MVMRFFGGGVGHSQSPNQHSKDTGELSGSESEPESEPDVSIGNDNLIPDIPINSDNDEDIDEAGGDSDNVDTDSPEPEELSDLECESDDDGYDSL
jgi:hypothetical protein